MAPRDQGGTDLPSTLERSPQHAQEIWRAAHDSAVGTYGEGQAAHRVAFAALKHSYEKVGDHWEPKAHTGPSDPQAAREGAPARDQPRQTAQGVDANASKAHLYELAKRLEVPGRSRMDRDQLVEAIERANARATRRARDEHR